MRMFSTRPGAVSAYADLETLLQSPLPTLLTARTLNVYALAFSRPPKSHSLVRQVMDLLLRSSWTS